MENDVVSVGAAASLVPVETPPISPSIGYDETPALLGQRAKDVLSSPAAACVTNGFAVYNESDGKQVAIGDYGLTPEQLERMGVIKSGSAKLIRSQVASGVAPKKAFADSMFTSKFGVTTFDGLVGNKAAQASIQQQLFQVSQNSLVSAGLIKGTEASDQISGLVYADSKFGTAAVVQTVKAVNSKNVNTSIQASKTAQVLRYIGQGNNAAAAATIVNGPGKGLAASIAAYASVKPGDQKAKINAQRGLRGAAVDAVVSSFGKIEPYVPVSLSQIARQNGQQNWSALMLVSPGGFKDYLQLSLAVTGRNAVNTAIQLAKAGASGDQIISGFWQATSGGAVSSFTGLQTSFLGAYQGLKAAALFLGSGQFSLAANALATGLGGLPGGIGVAANALQSGISAIRVLPGQISNIFSTARDAVSGFQSAVQTGSIVNTINNFSLTGGILGGGSQVLTTSFSSTGYMVDQAKTIFNAGSAAFNQVAQSVTTALTSVVAIYNAVSAIASLFGGKRKTKTVTISTKTAVRTGFAAHATAILADERIPRPIVFDEFESEREAKAAKLAAAKKAAQEAAKASSATGNTSNLDLKGGGTGAVRGNQPTGSPGTEDASLSTISDTQAETQAQNILREAELMSSARQNFLNTEVKAAQDDYAYAVKTRKQGDPLIAQKRDYMNYLISNMDNIIKERNQSFVQAPTQTSGSLLVDGVPVNNQASAPQTLYNLPAQTTFADQAGTIGFSSDTQALSIADRLSGIPEEYRPYFQRFGKLPPGVVIPQPESGVIYQKSLPT